MSNKFFKSPYFYIPTFLGCAAVIIAASTMLISSEPSNEVIPQSSVTSAVSSAPSSEVSTENPVATVESSLQISSASPSSVSTADVSSSKISERPTGIYGKLFDSRQDNPDTVGWLTIDGTKCDYAVMQSDDNDYYLERNENKKKSDRGALFADFRCDFSDELSKNTIIYGHSMKDGSMFTQLFVYKKLSTLKNQPVIEFATDEDAEDRWKIFACMITDTSFNYIQPDPNDDEFMDMVDEIRRRSLFDTDVDVTEDDKILTLSTCTYEYDSDDVRFVVVARRMRPGEDEAVTVSKNENVKSPQL